MKNLAENPAVLRRQIVTSKNPKSLPARLILLCAATSLLFGCHREPETKVAQNSGLPSSEWTPAALDTTDAKNLHVAQMEQLKNFSGSKETQAKSMAAQAGDSFSPDAQKYFDAAKNGDWQTVERMFRDFAMNSGQYSASSGRPQRLSYWQPILEVDLAYECVIPMEPKTAAMADDIVASIPPGSIYFGGTDPGRGLITAFCKSQVDGDPFYTLTQNALADPSYLDYLRQMYGSKIQIPGADDSQKCFSDYLADAQERLDHDQKNPNEPRQIKPGEEVKVVNGHVSVSGQIAVMNINARIARVIFDRNPGREFYIEESFPLDWMYPCLEPHGAILKINREKTDELPDSVVAEDRDYWTKKTSAMLGDWLTEDTSVKAVANFIEKVYVQKDVGDFKGDKAFIANSDAQKFMSKLRSSIGGVYWWHAQHAASAGEKERMNKEADFAFRQAVALCPYSPEALYRYVNLLETDKRNDDAIQIVSAALKVDPKNQQFHQVLNQLQHTRSN